ncbi:hypothetical protein RS030_263676 [Cryptosporidium xiaoi]|uniref:Uncharacterized protein n=1 Tax=Cryptosporidium xiaoi TaxID=659607 RepID=A0AAV9XWB3_9CRYT
MVKSLLSGCESASDLDSDDERRIGADSSFVSEARSELGSKIKELKMIMRGTTHDFCDDLISYLLHSLKYGLNEEVIDLISALESRISAARSLMDYFASFLALLNTEFYLLGCNDTQKLRGDTGLKNECNKLQKLIKYLEKSINKLKSLLNDYVVCLAELNKLIAKNDTSYGSDVKSVTSEKSHDSKKQSSTGRKRRKCKGSTKKHPGSGYMKGTRDYESHDDSSRDGDVSSASKYDSEVSSSTKGGLERQHSLGSSILSGDEGRSFGDSDLDLDQDPTNLPISESLLLRIHKEVSNSERYCTDVLEDIKKIADDLEQVEEKYNAVKNTAVCCSNLVFTVGRRLSRISKDLSILESSGANNHDHRNHRSYRRVLESRNKAHESLQVYMAKEESLLACLEQIKELLKGLGYEVCDADYTDEGSVGDVGEEDDDDNDDLVGAVGGVDDDDNDGLVGAVGGVDDDDNDGLVGAVGGVDDDDDDGLVGAVGGVDDDDDDSLFGAVGGDE